jgi:MFS family permease
VEDKKEDKPAPKGLFDKLYGLESNVASKDFTNRWAMVIPAFATHMCIGSPYAWSLMADAITREYGFVAPTSADWALSETAFPISIIFMMMGLSSAAFGKWQVKVGPRAAVATAALAFGGGFGLGAAGIYFHNLPMLYAGYGFLGGAGLGLAYTPPVQTLMEWFPDKKGEGLISNLNLHAYIHTFHTFHTYVLM